jgi:hypothetical protein
LPSFQSPAVANSPFSITRNKASRASPGQEKAPHNLIRSLSSPTRSPRQSTSTAQFSQPSCRIVDQAVPCCRSAMTYVYTFILRVQTYSIRLGCLERWRG